MAIKKCLTNVARRLRAISKACRIRAAERENILSDPHVTNSGYHGFIDKSTIWTWVEMELDRFSAAIRETGPSFTFVARLSRD